MLFRFAMTKQSVFAEPSYIDAHIHLDAYSESERRRIVEDLPAVGVKRLITVSNNLASCQVNHDLFLRYPDRVSVAYGFHPEQPVPTDAEQHELFQWIRAHRAEMSAVGEVGLPYYMRRAAEERGEPFEQEPYIELLDRFMALAAEWDKPIVLHAVYEDAQIACGLLEKHRIRRAHFHWFKGSPETVQRMAENGYFISFTPEIVYRKKIQDLAEMYPLQQVMAETDGPWPFEGPFQGQPTHPRMIRSVIRKLAEIKGLGEEETARIVLDNTERFYYEESYASGSKPQP